jgi:photosystem II stability/assembly factor-like uncharacterized protein
MRHALTVAIAIALAAPAFGKTTRTDAEARWQAWEQHQQLEQSSLFAGLKWRSIGPTVQGGRIVDVEVHPDKPYTFYVAYASGGVWKTSNNGVTFTPLSDDLASMISGDIAIDPQAPDTLWVGTGEPNSSRSSYSGLGMFVSRDGGKTFEHAGLTDADRIARVRVDPKDSQRVFVAVQGPLYTPGGKRGIFRTIDGGQSWQQVLAGDGEWTGAIDLIFDPRDSKIVYAAMWERSRRPWNFVEGGPGSGVWKSTDGGDNWTRLAGFPKGEHVGRIGLAISPANPDRIYASIDNQEPLPENLIDLGDRPLSPARLKRMSKDEFLRQDPDEIEMLVRRSDFEPSMDGKQLIAMIKSGELTMDQLRAELTDGNAALFNTDIRGLDVWRSDDAGGSWARANVEPIRDVTYTYGYYFGEIRVAPDNADRVYVLGVPTAISEDGGATWSGRINDAQVHVDHHAFEIDPNNPQRLFNGNDGGLDVSYDGGESWVRLDAQSVGQSYTLGVDMAEPYNVYTGMQDNGTWKGSSQTDPSAPGGFWGGGDGWSFLNGGDGMQVQVDPRDPSVVYTGYQFGWYRRGGKDGGEVRPRAALADPSLRFNWNTPILLSEHNPDILYMGANKLYRSMDQGRTWRAISGDLTRNPNRGDVPFATITTVAESSKDFGLIAAGTDDGLLWITEDGGQQWREITKGLPKDRWVSRVVTSSHNRGRLYASFTGYREDDMSAYVYVSEDLGKSWRSIAANLPAEPVNVIKEDPVNADVLYVGSNRGVYVSLDRGGSWQALPGGLPNVPVHDLVVHPRDRELVAGTHGRSVWIVDALPIQDLTADVRAKPAHLFFVADVDAARGWRSAPDRWFDHNEVKPKSVIHYWAAQAGSGKLTIKDADGNAVRVLDVNASMGINRVDYDLLVDADLGVAAEAARVAKAAAKAEKTSTGTEGELGKTPLAESKRLGHALYITPGEYTLALELGGATADTKFSVNAPKAFEARVKPKYKLRGR